jgi:hypothetical protein
MYIETMHIEAKENVANSPSAIHWSRKINLTMAKSSSRSFAIVEIFPLAKYNQRHPRALFLRIVHLNNSLLK